jgi:hypothetical protein
MMDSLKLLIGIILVSIFFIREAAADYIEPTSRTQINQQTDLFEKSVDNLKSFEQQLEEDKAKATSSLDNPSKALDYISDKSQGEIESEANDLSSIGHNDLADKGRAKLVESNLLEEIYLDETKPLYIQYKKDVDAIAEASSKMLGNLLGMLKDLGVDCRTAKGNKVVEPEYFIDLKRTTTKDTVYNKTICEELRNKYNCRDILTMRCSKKAVGGRKFVKIIVPYAEIDHIFLRDPREPGVATGLFNAFSCDSSKEKLRQYLVAKVGNDKIEVPDQGARRWAGVVMYYLNGLGQRGTIQNHWHPEAETWAGTINLYYYIGVEDNCSEWQESWEERCNLQ